MKSKGKREEYWRSRQCIKNHLKVTDVRRAPLCLSPAVFTRFFQPSCKSTSHALLDTSDMQQMQLPYQPKIEKRNYIRFRGNSSVCEHELAVLSNLSGNPDNARTFTAAIFISLFLVLESLQLLWVETRNLLSISVSSSIINSLNFHFPFPLLLALNNGMSQMGGKQMRKRIRESFE